MSRDRGEEETSSVVVFYLIVFVTLILDQASKFLALVYLSSIDTFEIIPNIFHLTLVYNTGIAFGFFRDHPEWLLFLITLSLVALFAWGWAERKKMTPQHWGIALVLGGALGNWIDRIRVGAVIDFLDFRVWPVFNIADSAISVGVAFYFILLLKKPK